MNFNRKSIFDKINVPERICEHVLGPNHTEFHRRVTGVLVMILGVAIVKMSLLINFWPLHFSADVLGYFVHGFGAVPFFKALEESYNG